MDIGMLQEAPVEGALQSPHTDAFWKAPKGFEGVSQSSYTKGFVHTYIPFGLFSYRYKGSFLGTHRRDFQSSFFLWGALQYTHVERALWSP